MEYKKKVEYKGEKYGFTELAEKTGLSEMTLRYRIDRIGLTPEEAVSLGKSKKNVRREIAQRRKKANINDFKIIDRNLDDIINNCMKNPTKYDIENSSDWLKGILK